MIINVDLATTKSIKIEKINNNSVYIYEKHIDGVILQEDYKILVKNQTSYYLNNLYIIKANCLKTSLCNNNQKIYDGIGFLCHVFDKTYFKNDEIKYIKVSNNDIYNVKYGKINRNNLFIKSKDNNSLNTNIYLHNNTYNIKKLSMINNTFSLKNSNYQELKRLYSLEYYLYYFKSIEYFNKLNDTNILSKLNNNEYLINNKIIISNNKKYFLTINNNGYLVLYNNDLDNNNLNTVKWYYPCDILKKNNILFDNNNNLVIKENISSKKIIINNNSYKYKGLLINQGPKFNTLIYNNKTVNLPDEIELYENLDSDKLYINPKNNNIINLNFNKNDNKNRQLKLLISPHPDHILSDLFRPKFNYILEKINKNKMNNISDLKVYIKEIIKNETNPKKNTIIKSPSILQIFSTFLEDKEPISDDNLNTYIDIIINNINNNKIIEPPKYYIFDNISNLPENILDKNNKQTIYFFKLQESNNFSLSKNNISIDNNGNIIENINNTNITVWKNSNNIDCENLIIKDEEDIYKKDENIKKNLYLDFPIISTNFISSDYIKNNILFNNVIKYNFKYYYILINNNDFKITSYLKNTNTYFIYLVHSVPDINNYNINDILNIYNNPNRNNIIIKNYSINKILDLSNIKKYNIKNSSVDYFISNRSHITYIEFNLTHNSNELNIFKNNMNKYDFNLHQILIFNNLQNIQEKINIFKYLNKKWCIYLNNDKNYNSDALNYLYYNNKLNCDINCFNFNEYKKFDNIYNKIYNEIDNIKINFVINLNINNITLDDLFKNVLDEIYTNIIKNYENPTNLYKFIKNKIIILKNLDFNNNLLYQFKHFLPYIQIKGKNIDISKLDKYSLKYDDINYNITKEDISLLLPKLFSVNFIILLINQDNKNNNGLYLRNIDNSFTKILININKYNEIMFEYATNYKNFNMTNIIFNKSQKSSLYEKKYIVPIPINFNNYTKLNTKKEDICFNFFMLDYIDNYSNKELLFVDLATTNNINIKEKDMYIINLPDILKENCITCNIYNFLKIKKKYLYILVKNQINKDENGIYKYKFKNNDILKKEYKISLNQCSDNILIYVLNGIENQNKLYSYNNNTYLALKKYINNNNICQIMTLNNSE